MEIVPELSVADSEGACAMLERVFGFVPRDGLMCLGDQRVAVVQGAGGGHGVIDHLALAVADLDKSLVEMRARGAVLDDTTPEGPREIAEFWDSGVRYVFLRGPEGARIELCARRGGAPRSGLPRHDHVGIPCSDIAATEAFFLSLGLSRIAAVDLDRPEGMIPVRFLSAGRGVVELYSPPAHDPASLSPRGLWRGLRLSGTGMTGERTGPDGLRVTLA
jgi:catechol 2,3-dioxygenase-like lactoylglutathione lyase family enzyme